MEKINNNYQLSKTLRFELKPIGKTLELMIIDKIKRSDDLKKID
jgi:CRISPR-associated protein Cpf1